MFKFACATLLVYALIGLVICFVVEFESNIDILLVVLLFITIPLIGAYGVWKRNIIAIAVSVVPFVLQSVRSISPDRFIPNIAPITISLPVGDFSNGNGYLVDFFALFMILYLTIMLSKLTNNKEKYGS